MFTVTLDCPPGPTERCHHGRRDSHARTGHRLGKTGLDVDFGRALQRRQAATLTGGVRDGLVNHEAPSELDHAEENGQQQGATTAISTIAAPRRHRRPRRRPILFLFARIMIFALLCRVHPGQLDEEDCERTDGQRHTIWQELRRLPKLLADPNSLKTVDR